MSSFILAGCVLLLALLVGVIIEGIGGHPKGRSPMATAFDADPDPIMRRNL